MNVTTQSSSLEKDGHDAIFRRDKVVTNELFKNKFNEKFFAHCFLLLVLRRASSERVRFMEISVKQKLS
jgi:hypothetical protein